MQLCPGLKPLWLSAIMCVQVIIEKAYESVQKDHVKDALSLFVDFMAIFVSFPDLFPTLPH